MVLKAWLNNKPSPLVWMLAVLFVGMMLVPHALESRSRAIWQRRLDQTLRIEAQYEEAIEIQRRMGILP